MPVDCELGETCFIQKYVDRDPGPDYRDFGCGQLSNDGHRGTDIALYDHITMEQGINVLAAANGTVAATRDGMPDILITDPNAPDVTGRACGNAVIVNHPNGWQTRYCHLKRGSLRVKLGMAVTTDTLLGQVGLSGSTEFPHLHISVFKDNVLVDPFQPDPNSVCGAPVNPLWIDPIDYVPSGIISNGFSSSVPEFAEIKIGTAHRATLSATSPALVLWTHIFGGQTGDIVRFEITGPQGSILNQSALLKRTQSRLFRASGRKLSGPKWPTGPYTGVATLIRDGREIGHQTTILTVTD
jgi:hypothetical protein